MIVAEPVVESVQRVECIFTFDAVSMIEARDPHYNLSRLSNFTERRLKLFHG